MRGRSTDLLDGRSRRARRAAATAACAVALALGASLSGSGTPSRPHASRAALGGRAGPVPTHPAGPTYAAVRFARSYVGVLYGRDLPDEVAPVSGLLRRRLELGRALITPAESSRQVVVRDLRVGRLGPRTASVTGLIDDGDSPPLPLSFNLTFTLGRWTVTAVDQGVAP